MSTLDNILARTIWGEARGEGIAGMEAVACVILNRVHSGVTWWGTDIDSVCMAHRQFSCWNEGDPNREKCLTVDTNDPQYNEALGIEDSVSDGTLKDTVNGATSYKVTVLPWPEAWGEEVEPVAVVGHQSFYILR